MTETEGKEAAVKAVAEFGIDGDVGGGTTSMVRQGFVDDGFRC